MIPYLTLFWTKTQISRLLYCSRLCMENRLNGLWPKSMLLVGFRLTSQTSCCHCSVLVIVARVPRFPKTVAVFKGFSLRWTDKHWCTEAWRHGMKLIAVASNTIFTHNMHLIRNTLCNYPIDHLCSSVMCKIMQVHAKHQKGDEGDLWVP